MNPFVSAPRLTADLDRLGVPHGGVVMVHASLRKLGPVEGGATGVLAALRQALGPTGTVLMVLSAIEVEGAPFDAAHTPVDTDDMGVLAEVFRQHPGVQVNDHAADRFGAWGPHAGFLLNPTPQDDYHGPGSVLARLVEADGCVLRLGANPDTVTLTHYAEYLAKLPNKRRVRRRYQRADVGEQWIESLDDTDGIAVWAHGDYFPQIFLDFVAAGRARVGPVGNCSAELLPARDFVRFAAHWLETNVVGAGRIDPIA
jgi:aminoglycoside N3'-acetyltransferase